jgi:hypothetical protein
MAKRTNGSNGTAVAEAPAAPAVRGRKGLQGALQEAEEKMAPGSRKFGRRLPAEEKGKTPMKIDVSKLLVQPSKMTVWVKGIESLIVHNFGAKAVKMILDKQTGKAKPGPRALKDPFSDFKESLYIINDKKVPKTRLEPGQSWKYVPDTFGFPASGFKKAMVSACSMVEGVKKTWIRGLVHIHGNYLPIVYKELVMRQDTVRVGPFGKKSADIRFRGEFIDWKIQLEISYNRSAITPEQIAMLLSNAGFSVGIGEWRPEKDGSHGTFAIE